MTSIMHILEKMAVADKDFRYMATSDLYNELQKDSFQVDLESERRIVTLLLDRLRDLSGDVQGVAVKCLTLLVEKISENQVDVLVNALCNNILEENQPPPPSDSSQEVRDMDSIRDISSIALKTVIGSQAVLSPAVIKRLAPRLTTAVSQSDKQETKLEALDILNELVKKYPKNIPDHRTLQTALVKQLQGQRPPVRKRATACLGSLSVSSSDEIFAELVQQLLSDVRSSSSAEQTRAYIQTIATVSHSVGYRLGKHLGDIVPLLAKYVEVEGDDGDDELREHCLNSFESFILRCPKEIGTYLNDLTALALKYLKYDPNFAGDDDDEYDDMETEEEDEYEDSDDGEEYTDDEDVSWKVRRACTKCLSAVIASRPDLLSTLNTQVAPVLVARFKEREENVKLDVFSTFVHLLRQTGKIQKSFDDSVSSVLRGLVPDVVKALSKELREKSLKTRVGAFALIKELVVVLPGSLSEHVASFVPGFEKALMDKHSNSALKIEALTCLRAVFVHHQATAFHPHMEKLFEPVLVAVKDRYYKSCAEALRVCKQIVKVIRPSFDMEEFDFRPFARRLYDSTFAKLQAQDQDQEVKESAILCMGSIITYLSDANDLKPDDLSACLRILADRLHNEITRLTTVKSLGQIAESPLKVDLSSILEETVSELASFLRKSNRALRQASLLTLKSIIRASAGKLNNFDAVFKEATPLISDSDLHLAHLALQLCITTLQSAPNQASSIQSQVLPKVLELSKSALLQGQCLQSTLDLLSALVPAVGFKTLLDSLMSIGTQNVTKQAFSSLSKCIGAVTFTASASERKSTVDNFLKNVSATYSEVSLLSLLSLGEIGRISDLSSHSDIQTVIIGTFDSTSEEIKSAASFALGSISIGNLSKFLPFVLEQIKAQPKNQYLLLHSLKEIFTRQAATAGDTVKPYVERVLPILFEHSESEEEGIRNVVAECLGRLALVDPPNVIPRVRENLKHAAATRRGCAVTSLKFAVVETETATDQVVEQHLEGFLSLLRDSDLHVRRAALLTFNSVAHNKPALIRAHLEPILPTLLGETKVKPELIRQVDLGPFKHTLDDGLELRKAAFECIDTLLDSCLDRLDCSVLLGHITEGLGDHFDIKMLCHLMLSRLATIAPLAVLGALEQLVEPLRTTITATTKDNAVKQEVERNEDAIRSALRAIYSLSKIPDSNSCVRFSQFMSTTVEAGKLGDKYQAISAESDADPMDLS